MSVATPLPPVDEFDDRGVEGVAAAAAAAGGPGAVGEGPDLMYVALVSTGITDDDEEDTDDPEFCFLCHVGTQPGGPERNHYLDMLQKLLDHNYTLVRPLELTRQAQRYYNTNLRPYLAQAQLRKPWRKRVIWDHIHYHHPTSRTITMASVRALQSCMSILENKVGVCV